MKSFRTDVRPEVLVWARKKVNLDIDSAASKMGVSTATLVRFESGESSPTLNQLQNMARVYRQPLAILYLRTPPTTFDPIKRFRRLAENHGYELSYELISELKRIRRQQDVMSQLLDSDEEQAGAQPPNISLESPVSKAAEEIRNWIDLEERLFDGNTPARDFSRTLIAHVESQGVLVTQIPGIHLEEFRGLALSDHPFPAIVLNGKDSPRAKNFTIIHELVHICLDKASRIDFLPVTDWSLPDTEAERFCNEIAAEVLMQTSVFLNAVNEQLSSKAQLDEAFLEDLASRFHVSSQAVMIKMIHLNLANWNQYFAFDWGGADSAVKDNEPQNSSLPIYYPMKIRNMGRRYINEVRIAYDAAEITTMEALDFLDIKLENLPKLFSKLEPAYE